MVKKPVSIYQVTYDPNGGTGNKYIDLMLYTIGVIHTLLEDKNSYFAYEREKYMFTKRNLAADSSEKDYSIGDLMEISGNVVLYAQWQEKTTDLKSEIMPIKANSPVIDDKKEFMETLDNSRIEIYARISMISLCLLCVYVSKSKKLQ